MPENTEVTPEIKALALQIAQNKAKEIAAKKVELAAKYPHADVSTLAFDASANKYSVQIRCTCGGTRKVFTSDLFQVTECEACAKAAKASRKASKKALLAKAMELIAKGEVK